MTTKIKNLPVEWRPLHVQNRWLDVFVYPINSGDGLPVQARAVAVARLAKQLQSVRNAPCLCIEIHGSGNWYRRELEYAVRNVNLPIAVTKAGTELRYNDFCKPPAPYPAKPAGPKFNTYVFHETQFKGRDLRKLQVLRSLARMSSAGLKEIASLIGLGTTYTSGLLRDLTQEGYISLYKNGMNGKVKNNFMWEINRSGIRQAHWSWNIPDGTRFKSVRREQKTSGSKHRKLSRLWPWWLRKAYDCYMLELWSTWVEPAFDRTYPDALSWGTFDGQETLFWLEVDSGKRSKIKTIANFEFRYRQVVNLANQCSIQIVFVILAQPWVLKTISKGASFSPDKKVAVILENWNNKTYLGYPIFGDVTSFFDREDFPLAKNAYDWTDPHIGF